VRHELHDNKPVDLKELASEQTSPVEEKKVVPNQEKPSLSQIKIEISNERKRESEI